MRIYYNTFLCILSIYFKNFKNYVNLFLNILTNLIIMFKINILRENERMGE